MVGSVRARKSVAGGVMSDDAEGAGVEGEAVKKRDGWVGGRILFYKANTITLG